MDLLLNHEFEALNGYNGSSINSVVLSYGQSNIDPVIFLDLSSVPVTGSVMISSIWSASYPGIAACGQPNVIVSAFSLDDVNFEDAIFSSLPTTNGGVFSLAVSMQQQFVLVPQYGDDDAHELHTFSPPFIVITADQTPSLRPVLHRHHAGNT